MIAFVGSGRVSGASWSLSEVSGAGPECSGGVSGVSDAMSGGSDATLGCSDAVSGVSGGVSGVSDAVSGVSDAASEVSDAVSDCLHNCRVRGCWRGDPWVLFGGSSSSGPVRYPARCRITPGYTAFNPMRVFISWSGTTSRTVAEALRDWLPDIIQEIDPWMSASDLEAGVRWAGEIGKSLEQTDFGIICLTPSNLLAPWILFEAGALSKRFESARVLPYLFQLPQSRITGPLAQFQNVDANKEGTRRLVGAIYASLPETALSPERLDRAFERWWPNLEEALGNIPDDDAEAPPPRPEEVVLEEILGTVRSLQRHVIYQERRAESELRDDEARRARIRELNRIKRERENSEEHQRQRRILMDYRRAHPDSGIVTVEQLEEFEAARLRQRSLDFLNEAEENGRERPRG